MNGGQIDWRELFLSSAGRLPRTPFLIASAVLIAIAAVYEGVTSPIVHWLTGLPVYAMLLFCGVSVLAKRLHDRGRSGWWAALVLFALVVVWPHPHGFFGLAFSIVLIWAIVELGVMPGEQGANRYGPNPLTPVTA
jgi:uncharacterized membrane protein YhaH (DUF805 family)